MASLLALDCVTSTVTDGNQPLAVAEATLLRPSRQPHPSPNLMNGAWPCLPAHLEPPTKKWRIPGETTPTRPLARKITNNLPDGRQLDLQEFLDRRVSFDGTWKNDAFTYKVGPSLHGQQDYKKWKNCTDNNTPKRSRGVLPGLRPAKYHHKMLNIMKA